MSSDMFDSLKDKAGDLADQHGDKIDQGIDKAADLIDEKTGGKFTDQIEQGAEEAKEQMRKLGDDEV